jgi:hypothetical protein
MSNSIKKKEKRTFTLIPGNKLNDPEVFAALYKYLSGKNLTEAELTEAMAIMAELEED